MLLYTMSNQIEELNKIFTGELVVPSYVTVNLRYDQIYSDMVMDQQTPLHDFTRANMVYVFGANPVSRTS